MEKPVQPVDRYNVTISGNVSGQVAVGQGIHQSIESGATDFQPRQELLEELLQELAALKEQVTAAAPPDKANAALERVDELAGAITNAQPDLSTMEYVRNWFARNLPALAGAVTSVIVNPIVGRLVEAAGDAVAAEFRRRFGIA